MYKIKVLDFYKISLLILSLQSMFAWFLWGEIIVVVSYTLTILTGILFVATRKKKIDIHQLNLLSIVVIIFLELYFVRELKITAFLLSLLRIISLSILILLTDDVKVEIFKYLTKVISYILAISLVWWILYLIGIPLPKYFIDSNYGPYNNYYFFIIFVEDSIFSILPRFSSIFLEPGYLGMLTTFLIVANKFQIKNISILILYLATFFSFSLAAFLVLSIAISIYLFLYSRYFFIYLVILFSFFCGLYLLSLNLNDGENAVYNYIFRRLTFDDGEMVGYNRFSEDLDFFYSKLIKSGDVFLGIGEQAFRKLSWSGGNAGYKVFIIQYGIVGVFFVFLFYLTQSLKSINKMTFILCLVYFLVFLQASYPLIEVVLIIFITSIPSFKHVQKN